MSATIRRERNRISFRASRMGLPAARTLAVPRTGTIEAVFDRSAYCLLGGEHVCLGVESLGMGPLTVTLDIPETRWSSLGFRTGLPVTLSPGRMEIGNDIAFDIAHARIWSPPPSPAPRRADVRRGLRIFEEAAAGLVPQDGLGRFVFVDPSQDFAPDRVTSYAEMPLACLKSWISDNLGKRQSGGAVAGSAWEALLGLGPGLTPSGDDFLGGMMIALHGLGESGLLRSLSLSVEGSLAERTTPISAAYLRAAMKGMGNEVLHDVMKAVLSGGGGGGVRDLLKAAGKVGHTSGWDALAGMVVTCRLWAETTTRQER